MTSPETRYQALRSPHLGAVLVAALAVCPAARADLASTDPSPPSPPAQNAARERYREAVAAYESGQFVEAIRLFRSADRLSPAAALSFNIARAYHKLGDRPTALAWYRDYLRRDPDAADAATVRAVIDDLEADLADKGLQQVSVLSRPSGATVVIDGESRGVTPWTGELPPGDYRLSLRLKGYVEDERVFTLPADEAVDVSVKLARAAMATDSLPEGREWPSIRMPAPAPPQGRPAEPAEAAAQDSPDTRPLPERPSDSPVVPIVGWSAVGLGVLSLGGAITMEVLRAQSADEARTASTQVGAADALRTMESRRDVARGLALAGGILAVGGGAVLAIDAMNDSPEPEFSARLRVGCEPRSCVAKIDGRFR